MITRLVAYMSSFLIAFSAIAFLGFSGYDAGALGENSQQRIGSKVSPLIEVRDKQGLRIAGRDRDASSAKHAASVRRDSVSLVFDRDYQPGDNIILAGPHRIAVRLDERMPECLLYSTASARGRVSYQIPYGRAEPQTGSAYAPESFAGKSHRISVRKFSGHELTGYRNLALNACDQQGPEQGEVQVFPHASSNSVYKNWPDFKERNAIDGVAHNGHHGIWPYQSWGPEQRDDLWWKVDFGRPVEVDKIRLMVRADLPHDSYWKTALVEFSDGEQLPLQMGPSAGFQIFSFQKRRISWLRLTHLVPAVRGKWCSFVEVEAWGHDL